VTGHVERERALINVPFLLEDNRQLSIEFVVDTGFEGAMTLPLSAIQSMGLTYFTQLTANLADGSGVGVDVFIATVLWDEKPKKVAVLAMGKRPLLGTALLSQNRLIADFTESGTLSITAL
jgi:clan AA aspartic protease